MMRPLNIFLGALFLLSIAACGNSSHLDVKNGGLNSAKGSLDFATVQSAIFSTRCTICHQQYSTYAGVQREISAIAAAVKSDRMPKSGGALSPQFKQLLQAWIADGAPEVAGQKPQPVETMLVPEAKSIFSNIILPKCFVCHNPQGQAKFLDLSNRNAIFAARDRVFAGGKHLLDFNFPQQSYLLDVIQDPLEPMPPILSNISRLSANEIQVLTDWIALGLP